MPRDSIGRRLLSALSGSTPAFTTRTITEAVTFGRRLIAALAGSTPAFTPGTDTDEHNSRPTTTQADDDLLDQWIRLHTGRQHIHDSLSDTPRKDTGSALNEFAATFATLLPYERLVVRAWFSMKDLAALRSTAQLTFRAYDLLGDLTGDRDLDSRFGPKLARIRAHELTRVLSRAREVASHIDLNLDHDIDLDRDIDLASDLTLDLTFDPFNPVRPLARTLAHALDLNLDLALVDVLAHSLTLNRVIGHRNPPTPESASTLNRFLAHASILTNDLIVDLANAYDLNLNLTHSALSNPNLDFVHAYVNIFDHPLSPYRAFNRNLTYTLARAIEFDRNRIRDLANNLDDRQEFHLELTLGCNRLSDALTNMTNADLRQANLHGIRLDGLRWSSETRWPDQWVERIRIYSIEIEPDLYEIRPEGIGDGATIDTLV
ncbi:hypothetical protein [Kutzneria sp. NPDC052558]|uniref:hypothetical protein n=1 Tax=Kutzneria sp. NPDC052558 TaxID=3364121 RepID=UPI0037C61045